MAKAVVLEQQGNTQHSNYQDDDTETIYTKEVIKILSSETGVSCPESPTQLSCNDGVNETNVTECEKDTTKPEVAADISKSLLLKDVFDNYDDDVVDSSQESFNGFAAFRNSYKYVES